MKKILAFLLFVNAIVFAQDKVERELGKFDEIKVFNGLNVTLVSADKPQIKITGEKADDVVVKNINGRLKLSMRFPETFNSDEVDVTVFYTDILSVIDVNEGAYITNDKTMMQDHIELKAQEGAIVDLDLKVKYLEVKSVTGGSVVLSGVAENQTVEVKTGATYNAYDLASSYGTITSASGGNARVNVKDYLDATVRFGGKIQYKNTPKELKTKKIIGGSIKSR